MEKTTIAFFLGLFSPFVLFFMGEKLSDRYGDMGAFVTFVVLFAYFFTCQFFLSRGNPDAYRTDWRIMLLLDGILLLLLIPMVLMEKREVILSQGLGILVACCGGTWTGAFAASMKARRRGK